MTANVPAIPTSDDLLDRIAREFAAEVVTHIEIMYPAAAKSVAWGSASRSLQGVLRNHMASASKAAEEGRIEEWLRTKRAQRSQWKKQWARATACPAPPAEV